MTKVSTVIQSQLNDVMFLMDFMDDVDARDAAMAALLMTKRLVAIYKDTSTLVSDETLDEIYSEVAISFQNI